MKKSPYTSIQIDEGETKPFMMIDWRTKEPFYIQVSADEETFPIPPRIELDLDPEKIREARETRDWIMEQFNK